MKLVHTEALHSWHTHLAEESAAMLEGCWPYEQALSLLLMLLLMLLKLVARMKVGSQAQALLSSLLQMLLLTPLVLPMLCCALLSWLLSPLRRLRQALRSMPCKNPDAKIQPCNGFHAMNQGQAAPVSRRRAPAACGLAMAMGVLLHDAAAVAFRNRAAMQRADAGSMADHSNSRCAAIMMQKEFIPTPHPLSSP